MFQSVRPYAREAGIADPVICYQGAAVVDPATGEFLRHEPIPLALAREAIDAVEAEGYMLNVYVDDELYVRELTPAAERYARLPEAAHHRGGRSCRLARPAAHEARQRGRLGRASTSSKRG